jgi:hypothetical protein
MALEERTDLLSEVLNEQYRVTQEYCNAQIALYNAHTARSPNHEFDAAFVNYEIATEQVQANLQRILAFPDIDEHKQLTTRILDTIYRQGAFWESGVAMNTTYNEKSTLVSLSILRASIQRIKETAAF